MTIIIKPGIERLVGMQQKAYINKNNIGIVFLNLFNIMNRVNDSKKGAVILQLTFLRHLIPFTINAYNQVWTFMGLNWTLRTV